jgi:hypothetical protein
MFCGPKAKDKSAYSWIWNQSVGVAQCESLSIGGKMEKFKFK